MIYFLLEKVICTDACWSFKGVETGDSMILLNFNYISHHVHAFKHHICHFNSPYVILFR